MCQKTTILFFLLLMTGLTSSGSKSTVSVSGVWVWGWAGNRRRLNISRDPARGGTPAARKAGK